MWRLTDVFQRYAPGDQTVVSVTRVHALTAQHRVLVIQIMKGPTA